MRFKRTLAFILVFILVFGTVCIADTKETGKKREIKVATFTIGNDKEVITSIRSWLDENDVYQGEQEIKVTFNHVPKEQIVKEKLEKYDLILVSGGDGSSVADAMGPDGGAAIEEYVAGGGGYMGLGGGAFVAPLGYTPETEVLEIINLKVDYPALNHGEGQLIVKPKSGTIITKSMQTGKNYIAYGINPPVLSPGNSSDSRMGAVIKAVEYVSNPTNNLEPEQTYVNMTGTPAVAAASFGSGRVVISGIQPQIEVNQPAELDGLLGQMLFYAAGIDDVDIIPNFGLDEPSIVGEWLWASTVYSLGADGAEKVTATYKDMGITDIYLLVKGTNGTVYYNMQDESNPSGAPKAYGDRDILQEVITAAHAKGIKVHAWITSANDKTYKKAHPEEGRYQFVRGRGDNVVENFNISFLSENFIEYSRKIASEIVGNYDVDGLHFDYIRYNHAGNGWGPEDRAMLTKPEGGVGLEKGYGLTQEDYNELVADLAKTFGYSIAKNPEGYYEYSKDTAADGYRAFTADNVTLFKSYADKKTGAVAFTQMRCDLVSNYAQKVTEAAREANPDLIISAALMPEGAYQGDYNVSGLNSNSFALVHYGQSYTDAAALYDYVCPMLYTSDFGCSAQWAATLVKNAINAGNKVVAGLQAFNPATSDVLGKDINAIRAILSGNMKGLAFFRTGMFNYIKTTVDTKNSLISVKLINARDSDYPLKYAKINLAQGITATEIIALTEGLSGATAELSVDGKSIILSNFNLPYQYHDGTVSFKYSGKLTGGDATFTVSGESSTADVRSYQITQYMD